MNAPATLPDANRDLCLRLEEHQQAWEAWKRCGDEYWREQAWIDDEADATRERLSKDTRHDP